MFAQKFEKSMRLPDKLKNREKVLQLTAEQAEETPRSGSYVICQDGTLIPIEDPDFLDVVTRQVTPDRM